MPLLALLVALPSAGCGAPSAREVEGWSQKGRLDRLAGLVERRGAPPEVRAQAAAALLARRRPDLVLPPLAAARPRERGPVVAYLVHGFLPNLLREDPRLGRDAWLLVRGLADRGGRQRLDGEVARSIVAELVRAGGVASPVLLDQLRLLGRDQPALLLPLLAVERPPYDLVLDGLAGAAPGHVEEARRRLLERAGRAESPDEPLGRALARLGETERLRARVAEGDRGAVAAARTLAHAPPSVELARFSLSHLRRPATAPAVRRALLAVVRRGGGPDLVPELLRLLRREPLPELRYALFEGALALGGREAAASALAALPAGGPYHHDEVVAHIVEPLARLGAESARAAARRALAARSPAARLAGILLLARVGEPGDARRLRRLARDQGRVLNLPTGQDLGDEAARVSAALGARGPGPS